MTPGSIYLIRAASYAERAELCAGLGNQKMCDAYRIAQDKNVQLAIDHGADKIIPKNKDSK